jgi:uncharacterized protein YndB with AHSA1/START domain
MAQQALLFTKTPRNAPRTHRRPRTGLWSIGMSICVNADARRIFQALTVAEYLEAWMSPPENDGNSYVAASRSADNYRLDFYDAGRITSSVTGSFLVCRQRKILFTWSNIDAAQAVSSVDIRLRGNFGSSILELRHAGLASAAEYFWQMAMWRASFEKLVCLMKNSQLGSLLA